MWFPSEQEAIEMFAVQFEARHRSGAILKARRRAEALKSKGDPKGAELWECVADKIIGLRQPQKVAMRRELEQV